MNYIGYFLLAFENQKKTSKFLQGQYYNIIGLTTIYL